MEEKVQNDDLEFQVVAGSEMATGRYKLRMGTFGI